MHQEKKDLVPIHTNVIFVAEMIESAGGSVPNWYESPWSPIDAKEFANPHSSYLSDDGCWSLLTECYKRGDVTAEPETPHGHVGIVTDKARTASARSHTIVKSAWGFDGKETFWRYQGRVSTYKFVVPGLSQRYCISQFQA